MFGRTLIAAAVVVAFASPAGAFYCPKNVKSINAAIGHSRGTPSETAIS